jgi:cytochrome c oxidase assembly protein subunit 15
MNAKTQNTNNPWLHRFAVLTAIITFLLLGVGGLVTSHGAGMSVPDWPTSYGYTMFALPFKFWKGGAFFEHSHRLLASGAGFLTTILAVWLWLKDSRRWVKWLGVIAFLLVVAQGVLGGLRVTLKMDNLGVIHGVVAQSFFILVCAIALFTGRFWGKWSAGEKMFCVTRGLRTLVQATTVLIFCQLVLGATMRGQHAGVAIPDFPTAYGKIWPDASPDAVAHYNAQRMDVNGENPITAFQIELQMFHRIVALTIGILVAFCAWLSWKQLGGGNPLTKLAWSWLALIVLQIGLGAWTIWSNKAADVATLHVLVGALSLVTGALWCIIAFGRREVETKIAPAKTISGAFGTSTAMAANK